jgi:hypothetical protein
VPKLSRLLKSAYDIADAEKASGSHDLERLENVLEILDFIRSFLVSGVVDTNVNQSTFEGYGILQQVLDLAFRETADSTVRAEVGQCLIFSWVQLTSLRHCILVPT